MNFLLLIGNLLGALVEKLAPLFFAFMAGQEKARHDFDKDLNEILEEDNEELRANSVLPDSAVSDLLRERADTKRKNQD